MCPLAAANPKTHRKGQLPVICCAHCEIHPHHNIIFLKKLRLRRKKIKLPEIFFRLLYFHHDQHGFWRRPGKVFFWKIISSCHSRHPGSMSVGICRRYNFQGIFRCQRPVNVILPEHSAIWHLCPVSLQSLIPDTKDPAAHLVLKKRISVINPGIHNGNCRSLPLQLQIGMLLKPCNSRSTKTSKIHMGITFWNKAIGIGTNV